MKKPLKAIIASILILLAIAILILLIFSPDSFRLNQDNNQLADDTIDMEWNPFKEYYLLQKYSKYVKKDQEGFKIYAKNGKITELKNIINDYAVAPGLIIMESTIYSLEHYFEDIGYFLFQSTNGGDYVQHFLVNEKTGKIYEICSTPNISPDRKKIILSCGEMGDGYDRLISINILQNRLEIKEKLIHNNANFLHWIDNDSAYINDGDQHRERILYFDINKQDWLIKDSDKKFVKTKPNQNKNFSSAKEEILKLSSNKAVVLNLLQTYYFTSHVMQYLSPELKDDKDIALAAVNKDASNLNDFSDRLKDDDEVVLAALNKGPYSIRYASNRIKNDKKFILPIIDKNPLFLEYASDELKDDDEIVTRAIAKDPRAFKYASARFGFNENKNNEVFQFLSNTLIFDNEMAKIAIDANPQFLEYASDELKNDDEIVMKAITKNPRVFKYASTRLKSNKEIALQVVEKYPNLLADVSPELKDDKEVVLKAASKQAASISYASDRLRGDIEIMMPIISKNPYSFSYLSNKLKDDKKLVLELVHQYPAILKDASARLKNDKEVVTAAALKDSRTMEYASDQLKNNKNFIFELSMNNIGVVKYSSPKLKDNKQFILKIINNYSKNDTYALMNCLSERLQSDEEIVSILKNKLNLIQK